MIEWHTEDCFERDCHGECHEPPVVECLNCGEEVDLDEHDTCPECGESVTYGSVDDRGAERRQMGITG